MGLRLAERFTHVVEADPGLGLVGPEDHVFVQGGVPAKILRLVDGTRTAEAIARALDGDVHPAEVLFTLRVLEAEGYVERSRQTPEAPRAPLLDPLARLLVDASRVWGPGEGPALVPASLSTIVGGPDIDIVLAPHYLDPRVARHAERAGDRRWIVVGPGPPGVWIGPVLTTGLIPCWRCVARRLGVNLPAQRLVWEDRRVRSRPARPEVASPTLSAPAALELTRHLRAAARSGTLDGLVGRILRVAPSGRGTVHVVRGWPDCPGCGHPSPEVPEPPSIRRRPTVVGSRGGYRVATPRETWRRFRHLVDPLTGIVRRVERVPSEDGAPVHNYTAAHAVRIGAPTPSFLGRAGRDHSGGKGTTDIDARVGALCEALERYSAVFQGNERLERRSAWTLGRDAVDLSRCLGFSDRQYVERDAWNATLSGTFQWVPEVLDPRVPIDWVRAWSLTDGRWVRVPAAYVHFGFDGPGTAYCRADSNGLAAGNCLEEAILQGFLELVERDAVALWWYNRTSQPGVDPSLLGDPWIGRVTSHYASLGRRLWVLELTTDLAIPCFAAISARTSGGPDEIILGFGAHLCPVIAMRRALCELNQALPTVVASPEERRTRLLPDFADAVRWWETARIEDHPYLLPAGDPGPLPSPAAPRADLGEAVHACVRKARDAGLEVLVVDLTRRDVGLPVAKVIVPGLRHFWKRLRPGRLYDVPVALGRLDRPRAEDEMNPVPVFL